MAEMVVEVLWVVAGAVVTALIAAAVAYWTVGEGRNAARRSPSLAPEDQ